MIEITKEKLKEILEKHVKWLRGEDGGEQADLSYADLSFVNLSYANLSHANLRHANLRGARLGYADLYEADLCRADLTGTDLAYANLRYAVLYHANLNQADFHGAHLCHADLCCTDLHYASLREADLRGADLRGADLTHAAYSDTALNLQCPEEGSFIAYKKLRDGAIAKLLIPEDAKRSSATSRKCRASKATILAIYCQDGEEITEGRSRHDIEFIYRVGETVYSDSWDEDRWDECSHGIHFFITRKEAEEY